MLVCYRLDSPCTSRDGGPTPNPLYLRLQSRFSLRPSAHSVTFSLSHQHTPLYSTRTQAASVLKCTEMHRRPTHCLHNHSVMCRNLTPSLHLLHLMVPESTGVGVVLAWRIGLVVRNWILIRFESWLSFGFLFLSCWFSSCVSVDGDWEHQVTLTNTPVKNIRPLSCFRWFVSVVRISVVLCWNGFAAVPLKCDESCSVGPDRVCQILSWRRAAFAITVLTVLKKKTKRRWKMQTSVVIVKVILQDLWICSCRVWLTTP